MKHSYHICSTLRVPFVPMAFSKFTAFVKPTLKGFALADNPFAYILVKRRVKKRPLKCRYFARVDFVQADELRICCIHAIIKAMH